MPDPLSAAVWPWYTDKLDDEGSGFVFLSLNHLELENFEVWSLLIKVLKFRAILLQIILQELPKLFGYATAFWGRRNIRKHEVEKEWRHSF